jgi:hypothetical protein
LAALSETQVREGSSGTEAASELCGIKLSLKINVLLTFSNQMDIFKE